MIAVVNYGLGNLHSVAGAVERLGFDVEITDDPRRLAAADKLILPGVGAFGDGMDNLRRAGLVEPLTRLVMETKKPVLGICLGCQLLARQSEEFGTHPGLGWIDALVERLDCPGLQLPHVGWNDLFQTRPSLLFDGIPPGALFYYVHSYHVACAEPSDAAGECEYGRRFTAVIHRDNVFAVQFHPEKSQEWGLALLRNFLEKA